MPLVRIDIVKGVRSPDQVKKLADVVQGVLLDHFNVTPRDRYQVQGTGHKDITQCHSQQTPGRSMTNAKLNTAVTELRAGLLPLCSLRVMGESSSAAKRTSSSTVSHPRNAYPRNPSYFSRANLTRRHFDNNREVSRAHCRKAQHSNDVLDHFSGLESFRISTSRSKVDVN
jgi:phenylpyruvate tautomerase PptA (4-oxalocrotonate tautomerase family)